MWAVASEVTLHVVVMPVRCPWCGRVEDRVVDSRPADHGAAIRRRRECLSCSRRFTTFDRVEERLRRKGPEVPSRQVGLEVLSALQKLDAVAYMRFASVYKDFQEVTDFERELGLLLEKKEPSKHRSR